VHLPSLVNLSMLGNTPRPPVYRLSAVLEVRGPLTSSEAAAAEPPPRRSSFVPDRSVSRAAEATAINQQFVIRAPLITFRRRDRKMSYVLVRGEFRTGVDVRRGLQSAFTKFINSLPA
jgi:hypothetical protein